MLHSNTELLIDYWRERKRGALCPARNAIDPSELSLLLPQVFILGRTAPGRCVFRLAGGLVTDVHGRDMRHVDVLSLWTETDRPRLAAALEASRRAAEPLVATTEARSAKGAVQIELTFAPLAADAAPYDRFLGLYQPLESLSPLQAQPAELRLRHIASAAEHLAPRLRLAAVDGRRIA
ncbi:MAG TPA: PAS domain-containing protein [Caulobacteraceae bacterium]